MPCRAVVNKNSRLSSRSDERDRYRVNLIPQKVKFCRHPAPDHCRQQQAQCRSTLRCCGRHAPGAPPRSRLPTSTRGMRRYGTGGEGGSARLFFRRGASLLPFVHPVPPLVFMISLSAAPPIVHPLECSHPLHHTTHETYIPHRRHSSTAPHRPAGHAQNPRAQQTRAVDRLHGPHQPLFGEETGHGAIHGTAGRRATRG